MGPDAGTPQELGPRLARGSKSNLLQGVARQSSAVNLTTLARDSDLKRLIEEVSLGHTHSSIPTLFSSLLLTAAGIVAVLVRLTTTKNV